MEPEDFLINPRAKTVQDSDFCSHRMARTRGELLAEGFDPDVVAKLDEEDMLKEDGSIGRDSVDSFRHDRFGWMTPGTGSTSRCMSPTSSATTLRSTSACITSAYTAAA